MRPLRSGIAWRTCANTHHTDEPQASIEELAGLAFIERREDVIFLGFSRTGEKVRSGRARTSPTRLEVGYPPIDGRGPTCYSISPTGVTKKERPS